MKALLNYRNTELVTRRFAPLTFFPNIRTPRPKMFVYFRGQITGHVWGSKVADSAECEANNKLVGVIKVVF